MPSKYQVVEVTNLETKTKSYKVFERPAHKNKALTPYLPTRAEAEAKVREFEEAAAERNQ